MARVYYVSCPLCQKEYYLDRILYEAVISNVKQQLKCPFCKKEFHLEKSKDISPEGKKE